MAISPCISLSNQASPINIDETGTHGTTEFPVAIYYDDVTENFVNWHWHAEIEIGYVEKGIILLECGNRKHTLNKGWRDTKSICQTLFVLIILKIIMLINRKHSK